MARHWGAQPSCGVLSKTCPVAADYPNQHYLRECRENTTERWLKHTVVWPSIGAAKPNLLHSATAATRDGVKSFMMNMKRC
jgi:hypothetical protein